jgi:uncharacterized protein HemY
MVVVGVLILLVVAIVSVAAIAGGTQPVQVNAHWFTIRTDVAVVYISGAVALLLAVFGFWILLAGTRRARRRRLELRDLRGRAERGEHRPAERSAPAATSEPGDADTYFDSAPRDDTTPPR